MIIDALEQKKALVHFYFGEDPDVKGIDWFAKCWNRVQFALEFEGKFKMRKK